MFDSKCNTITFPHNTQYEVGTVIYNVLAHFPSESDSLRTKLSSLLRDDIFRKPPDSVACS